MNQEMTLRQFVWVVVGVMSGVMTLHWVYSGGYAHGYAAGYSDEVNNEKEYLEGIPGVLDLLECAKLGVHTTAGVGGFKCVRLQR